MASAVLGVQSVWEPLNFSPFLFPPLSVSHLSFPCCSHVCQFLSLLSVFLSLSHSFYFTFVIFPFPAPPIPFCPSFSPTLPYFSPPPHCHTSAAMCWVLWSSPIFNLGYKILFLNTQRNRGGDWGVRGINKKEVGKGKRILVPCGVLPSKPWFYTFHGLQIPPLRCYTCSM